MTPAAVARESPLGAVFVVAAALAWLLVVALAVGGLRTGELLRVAALALVLSAFAVGFVGRTVVDSP